MGRHATPKSIEHTSRAGRLEAIDVHHVGAVHHGQVDRLVTAVAESIEWFASDLMKSETGHHQLAELMQLEAESITIVWSLRDVAMLKQRRQRPMNAAFAHAEFASELRYAKDGLRIAERLQDAQSFRNGRQLIAQEN